MSDILPEEFSVGTNINKNGVTMLADPRVDICPSPGVCPPSETTPGQRSVSIPDLRTVILNGQSLDNAFSDLSFLSGINYNRPEPQYAGRPQFEYVRMTCNDLTPGATSCLTPPSGGTTTQPTWRLQFACNASNVYDIYIRPVPLECPYTSTAHMMEALPDGTSRQITDILPEELSIGTNVNKNGVGMVEDPRVDICPSPGICPPSEPAGQRTVSAPDLRAVSANGQTFDNALADLSFLEGINYNRPEPQYAGRPQWDYLRMECFDRTPGVTSCLQPPSGTSTTLTAYRLQLACRAVNDYYVYLRRRP
ncbi:MAG: hypothetical protein U0641_12980 [Anaerolineae bacterium]